MMDPKYSVIKGVHCSCQMMCFLQGVLQNKPNEALELVQMAKQLLQKFPREVQFHLFNHLALCGDVVSPEARPGA